MAIGLVLIFINVRECKDSTSFLCLAYACIFFFRGESGPSGGGGARWMSGDGELSQAPLQFPSMMGDGALQWNPICSASSSRVAAGLALGLDP